jgi:hypothetical protein
MTDRIDQLPVPQRTAVRTAFGLDSAPPVDRFVVAVGILGVVTDLAARQPLLCIVDDEQWLDQASQQVLTFVARRLKAGSVGFVFASRECSDDVRALPTVTVPGLSAEEVALLLDSLLTGRLDARVRQQILLETKGNPLALVELTRSPGGRPGFRRTLRHRHDKWVSVSSTAAGASWTAESQLRPFRGAESVRS